MIEALGWLTLNLLSLLVLSFYSMSEMACVSFNKVRLHYYVSQRHKSALLIQYLLEHPAKLFGTTLIGVNIAMFCGSEFARQFHQALGLSPDWAPLSQVLIVVIFGELAPMFAARRYPERISFLSAPIMWFSIKIMSPLLWGIEKITTLTQKLIGGQSDSSNIFMSQEELQILIDEKEEPHRTEGEEFNTIVSNIFALRTLSVERLMIALSHVVTIPKEYTVEEVRSLMKKTGKEFFPVYDKSARNIVGIIIPRQLLRLKKEDKIAPHLMTPWFITQNANLSDVLRQFRTNKQNLAIVLNDKGRAIGILHLEQIMKAIFTVQGPLQKWNSDLPYIEKTINGEMTVKEFNQLFPVPLKEDETITLDEYCYQHFAHHPEEGETLFLSPYIFEIKEASLLEIKTLVVKITPKY